MPHRARFLTAALALWGCSSMPSSGDAAGAGAGVSPGAMSGQGSLTGESASPGESASAGENASGGETSGRPGGTGRFGGQTGGEAGIRCNADVALEPLDFDALSPLGYSAAQIVNSLAHSYAATFTYADDRATQLAVRLASEGRSAYAPGCSRIEIDVVVGWSSADGAFDETLRGKLFAISPDAATFDVEVPSTDLVGSYADSHSAELGPPPLSFSFELQFTASAAHGSVSALRGVAEAQNSLAIGSF